MVNIGLMTGVTALVRAEKRREDMCSLVFRPINAHEPVEPEEQKPSYEKQQTEHCDKNRSFITQFLHISNVALLDGCLRSAS